MKHTALYHACTIWLIMLLLLFCPAPAFTKGRTGTATDSMLHRGAFVFRAQWAIAYTGQRKQLTPPYELLVTSDSIDCYLPYFGRMYTVPTPEELRFMGIRFTSKKFSYLKHTTKRSGWDVTILPADVRNVQGLYFTVSRAGWTTLTIRSAGRDWMSYDGFVEPVHE